MTTKPIKLPPLSMNRSGRWQFSYAEKLPNGKYATRPVSTHTTNRAHAEAFRHRWLADRHALGALPEAGGLAGENGYLMADLIRGYLADLVQRNAGRSDQRSLPKIAESVIGALYPQQLTPEVILDWCRSRRVAQGTLRRDLQSVKAVLNWAIRAKRVKHDDAPHITLPNAGPPRDVWLDEHEEQRLWDAASQDSVQPRGRGLMARRSRPWHVPGNLTAGGAFICIALSTGARREAIMDLTWDRVDLKARTLDFRKPGRRVTRKVRPVSRIDDRLMPVMVRLKREHDAKAVAGPKVIEGDDWPRKRVFQILRDGGFGPNITPHVFRHTFITLSLRAGMSMWDVGEVAGVSPEMMKKHYAHHASDNRLLKEVNRRFAA